MKEEDERRYSGPATHRWFYMKEFLVECPKCGKYAFVKVDPPFSMDKGKLSCPHCSYSEKTSDRIRFKLTVKRNCDNCGKFFEKSLQDYKEKIDSIQLACPGCGIQRSYKPNIEEYKLLYESRGDAVDPIFGLPLWLQASLKENLFWAYNKEHLNDIKNYVKAKLRERQTANYTTMVEKLPGFIKDSKNRNLLLKIIDRLERK